MHLNKSSTMSVSYFIFVADGDDRRPPRRPAGDEGQRAKHGRSHSRGLSSLQRVRTRLQATVCAHQGGTETHHCEGTRDVESC